MKFLLKLFCLLSFLSSFSFSADVLFFSTEMANSYLKKSNVKFLANNKYVMFDRPDDPGHVYVDRVHSSDTYFYAGSLRGFFWNNQTGDVYYILALIIIMLNFLLMFQFMNFIKLISLFVMLVKNLIPKLCNVFLVVQLVSFGMLIQILASLIVLMKIIINSLLVIINALIVLVL